MQWILWFVGVYVFVVFVLSWFIVPHLGFRKEPLPEKIPKEMQKAIDKLKRKHKKPLDFAKAAYDFLSKKFTGTHALAFLRFDLLFSRDLKKLWSQKALPCNQDTLIYRIFLVKSGRFSEEQVRLRHIVIWAMIHQYIQIKHKGKWIDVDLWAAQIGIPFGKRSNFFTIAILEKYLRRQKVYKSRI